MLLKELPNVSFLRQLKRAKVPVPIWSISILFVYSQYYRLWSPCFPLCSAKISKRWSWTYPKTNPFHHLKAEISYSDGMEITKLCPLSDRRQALCQKLFRSIMNDPNQKLYHLLPTFNVNARRSLRHERLFIEPRYSTNRFRNSFIPASVHQFNMSIM